MDLIFAKRESRAPRLKQGLVRTWHHQRSPELNRRSSATRHERAAYLYLFTWPSPAFGGKFGAVHGVDVGLAFNNARGAMAGDTPEARVLAGRFAAAWVAFARTGNPNTPEIPLWPAYDAETRPTMIFDNEIRAEHDPLRELRTMWNELHA